MKTPPSFRDAHVGFPAAAPVMEAHEDVIRSLSVEALRLGVVTKSVLDSLLRPDGSIACRRSPRESGSSIQAEALYQHDHLQEREAELDDDIARPWPQVRDERQAIAAVRHFLHLVLAAQWNFRRHEESLRAGREPDGDPAEQVEILASGIDEVERICREHGMPSLYQYLWETRALVQQLRLPDYHPDSGPGAQHVLYQLGYIAGELPDTFGAVIAQILMQHRPDDILDLLDHALALQKTDLLTLFTAHPALADICISAYFESGDFAAVAYICGQPGANFRMRNVCLEKYLRSLVELKDFSTARSFLEQHLLPMDVRPVAIAVVTAVIGVAWQLAREQLAPDAAALLLRYCVPYLQSGGARKVSLYILQHNQGDPAFDELRRAVGQDDVPAKAIA